MTVLSNIINNEEMKNIRTQFNRLKDKCYLDNAGAALYPECLIRKINDDLLNNVYMNPHSDKYTKDCIEQIRYLVLSYFNTDSSNYNVIFTSGATHALKLVTESFNFESNNDHCDCGSFVYLRDNHTSVLGLREIAKAREIDIIHISKDEFLNSLKISSKLKNCCKKGQQKNGNSLFVYPAETNFNGYKYPINCMNEIKNGCLNGSMKKHLCNCNSSWYVMLDVASFISTNTLDLTQTQPDFVCLSFYKLFGYPTGLGALLVKNGSEDILSQKKYFGGGTVDVVLCDEDFHVKRKNFNERFEDGTTSFLSIVSLKHCFDMIYSLIPRKINNSIMDTISYHTFYLAKDLYYQLLSMHHKNGAKAIEFYMDSDFTDMEEQGGIITFNILRQDGSYIGYSEFQHMAELFNISIRTGCFCNSGTCQRHLKSTNSEVKQMYAAGHKCGDEIDLINGRPTGAIRVSFGYYNTFEDVDKIVTVINQCYVRTTFVRPERGIISTKNIKKENPRKEKSIKLCSEIVHSTQIINREVSKKEIFLSEIAIFPIKSCGAFKTNTWRVGQKGFQFDREWMIVQENGVCLTQKQNTRMCMVRPYIDLESECMILNFKGKSPITIPLNPLQTSSYRESSLCQSKVCTDVVKGYDCGDEVSDWISEALEISHLRLIKQSDDHERIHKKSSQKQTLLSLSNQAQFLLINKATVRWLKEKIYDPSFDDNIIALTDRFRGNLIIEMDNELVERDWRKVLIDGHEFKVESQCSRCQMVCIDQKTGDKTIEPLRTISEQFAGKLKFGIYLSYVGPFDKPRDCILKTKSLVTPIL